MRCTVGEISDALERAWGRHAASSGVAPGYYVTEREAAATGERGNHWSNGSCCRQAGRRLFCELNKERIRGQSRAETGGFQVSLLLMLPGHIGAIVPLPRCIRVYFFVKRLSPLCCR